MPVYRRFVLKKSLLFSTVSDRHDVHVPEFRPGFSPIAVGQNFVTADLGSSLDFFPRRNGPMKQTVESSHPDPACRRFDMFQEGRKSPDDLSSIEIFSHREK